MSGWAWSLMLPTLIAWSWVADPCQIPSHLPSPMKYLKIISWHHQHEGLAAIISSFPNLHHLALITKHPMERHTQNSDINFAHTTLQGLTLNVSAGEMLRYFSFPDLEHLEFGDFMTDPSPEAARAKTEMHGTRLTDSALNRVLRACQILSIWSISRCPLRASLTCCILLAWFARGWRVLRSPSPVFDPADRSVWTGAQFRLDLFIRYLKDTWPEALHDMDSDPPPAPTLLLDLHPAVGSNPIHIRHWDDDAKSREQYRILAAMGVKFRIHWAS
ncbi:hypothetical protein BKA70DRAFT_1579326 [Coprinopsis sp. MPI-PUGE-AT-0042]|nr:hypothetical protein BKA70DRAFT_1579326 [Coprinopsis sp. MPI-PUGE-AT-0042]